MNQLNLTYWPNEVAETYRKKGYWTGETFKCMLDRLALSFGDKIALEDTRTQWSFAALNLKSNQLAAGFHRLGLRAGDTAVVQLPNVCEFYAVLFGLVRIGVKPLLALPAHRSLEIASFCQHLNAKAYFFPNYFNGYDYSPLAQHMVHECEQLKHAIVLGTHHEFIELDSLYDKEQDFPAVPASDVAFLLVSGGSTGIPKIIPRTQDDYLYSIRESAKICGLVSEDVYLCVLPSAHNFSLSSPGALGALYQGARVVLAPDPSTKASFALIEQTGATLTALTPPLIRLWLEATAFDRVKSLRLIQVGGARLDPDTARMIFDHFECQLQQVFGMAEGLVCYTQLKDSKEQIIAAEVVPISEADELKIVDTNDYEVDEGQTGSLLVRGPYTLRGYWGSPAFNERCFSPDGFYRTGDLVKKTPEGRLVVMGRTKDVVNRGGELFSAEEVELYIRQHPSVIDAAVFAQHDQRMGERSCAVIMLRSPLTAPELRHYLRRLGLAAFKIPDRIEFTDELAKTAVGKTDKKLLQAKYLIEQGI